MNLFTFQVFCTRFVTQIGAESEKSPVPKKWKSPFGKRGKGYPSPPSLVNVPLMPDDLRPNLPENYRDYLKRDSNEVCGLDLSQISTQSRQIRIEIER